MCVSMEQARFLDPVKSIESYYYLNLYYLKIGENIDIYELHVIISCIFLYHDCYFIVGKSP